MITLFTRLGLGAALALPFYLILRWLYLRRKKARLVILHEIRLCAFILFMAGLILLVLWPGHPEDRHIINLVPFRTIRSFFTGRIETPFIINIIANILMFSPIGFCFPLFWQRFQKSQVMFLTGMLFSTAIESAQHFVGRSVDIDDVILNTAGVMLGYTVYQLSRHIQIKNRIR